jgi:hypothetical protein
MTFYNVISGILFIAACREFVHSLGTPLMWLAAILVVTILNETVLTSELIERQQNPVPYKFGMKLLDFVTFAVFSWLLLVLNPTDKNVFDLDVTSNLRGASNPRYFWSLLTVYWILMLVWNQTAGQRDRSKWKMWFFLWMHVMWVFPLIALCFNWHSVDLGSQVQWTVYLNLAVVSGYLLCKAWAPA